MFTMPVTFVKWAEFSILPAAIEYRREEGSCAGGKCLLSLEINFPLCLPFTV